MPELASLTNEAAPGVTEETAGPHEASILDDAGAPGDEVRCVRPGLDKNLATDPMPWTPYVTPDGFFYPKNGDRAVLAYPVDGPPVISQWWPAADAVPDSVL